MCNSFDKSGAYGVLLEKSREIQSGNIWRTEENGAWGKMRENARKDAFDAAMQPGGRVILHCDCNSFFASVETATHPEYRGVPMAVCGSQFDRHGIETKTFGTFSGEGRRLPSAAPPRTGTA